MSDALTERISFVRRDTDEMMMNYVSTLTYGYGVSRLGLVLAAQGEVGVASIFIGSDRLRLRRQLAEACPLQN